MRMRLDRGSESSAQNRPTSERRRRRITDEAAVVVVASPSCCARRNLPDQTGTIRGRAESRPSSSAGDRCCYVRRRRSREQRTRRGGLLARRLPKIPTNARTQPGKQEYSEGLLGYVSGPPSSLHSRRERIRGGGDLNLRDRRRRKRPSRDGQPAGGDQLGRGQT